MSGVTAAQVTLVHRRSKNLCEADAHPHCQGRAEHIHHRKLRSRGGGHTVANLLHVCHLCHGWIHDNPAAATEKGWMVSTWADPTEVRVVRWGWWLRLFDNGEWELLGLIEEEC